MTTTLRTAAFVAALAATSLITHHFWRSPAEAAPAGAKAVASTSAPWAVEGFRDDERCDMLSDPPQCN